MAVVVVVVIAAVAAAVAAVAVVVGEVALMAMAYRYPSWSAGPSRGPFRLRIDWRVGVTSS